MKRHPLLAFFILMFVISWGVWLWAAKAPGTFPVSPASGQIIGAFGPCLAALIVTGLAEGVSGLQKLFGRLLIWRTGLRWYLVALFLPAGILLLTTALHMMFGGEAPNFSDPPIYHAKLPKIYSEYNAWTILVPIFLQELALGGSLGEELGWRGFALERLQQGRSALIASLIVALTWTVWSWCPSWLLQDPGANVVTLVIALSGAIPASVVSTWIYNRSGGSLLLVVLYNNSIKITEGFVAAPSAAPIMPVIAFGLVALVILAAAGPATLSRQPAPARVMVG